MLLNAVAIVELDYLEAVPLIFRILKMSLMAWDPGFAHCALSSWFSCARPLGSSSCASHLSSALDRVMGRVPPQLAGGGTFGSSTVSPLSISGNLTCVESVVEGLQDTRLPQWHLHKVD